jgi:hypothetical protein
LSDRQDANTPPPYDYLIVGCGLYGATFARLATDAGDTLPVDARLVGVTLFYVTQANTDA